jgi:rhodanese-related sulfurtransferase
MSHSPAFLQLVNEAKKKIKECNIYDVKAKMDAKESFFFVDVREDNEWNQGRAKGAIHLGKGVIERDIESAIPDKNAPIILYCGGGFRSAIAAENLLRMGYQDVTSMDGGIRAWREAKFPEES